MVFKNFIGGEWVSSKKTFPSFNPAQFDEVVAEYQASDAEDAALACDAAAKAQPSWAALPAPARGEFLFKAAEILEGRQEGIARDQIGALRQAVSIPIDLYIEVSDNFGGFVRYYEMPQIISVGAPVYFKFGLRNAPDIYPTGRHIEDLAVNMGRERLRRARIALDSVARHTPKARMSPLGSDDLGIPEP